MRYAMTCARATFILLLVANTTVFAGNEPGGSTQPRRDDGRIVVRPPAPGPVPWQAGDCNCDGIVDLSDIEALVQMLMGNYTPPCCPS